MTNIGTVKKIHTDVKDPKRTTVPGPEVPVQPAPKVPVPAK